LDRQKRDLSISLSLCREKRKKKRDHRAKRRSEMGAVNHHFIHRGKGRKEDSNSFTGEKERREFLIGTNRRGGGNIQPKLRGRGKEEYFFRAKGGGREEVTLE